MRLKNAVSAKHQADGHDCRATSNLHYAVAGCALLTAMTPTVAMAGRLEQVCGSAPHTNLDTEALRQLDVDLGRRAGLPTSAHASTNEAQALAPDAQTMAATSDLLRADETVRELAKYRFCTWMLNGFITRDFYVEQRLWLAALSPTTSEPSAVAVTPPGADPTNAGTRRRRGATGPRHPDAPPTSEDIVSSLYALAPNDLRGRWVVQSSLRSGSCKPDPKVDADFYVWDVAASADGTVLVTVAGTTAYPILRGAFSDVNLSIGGLVDDGVNAPERLVGSLVADNRHAQLYAFSRSDFTMTATSSGRLIGERIVSVLRASAEQQGPEIGYLAPCSLVFDVTATKQ